MINRILWQDDSEQSEDRRESLLCAFETDSKSGDSPSIEKYLQQIGGSHQERFFVELLNIELYWRLYSGGEPSLDEYIDRFPQFELVIREIPMSAFHRNGLPLRMAHYRLTKEIGCGASGRVWRAMNERTDSYVALKIPYLDQARSPASRALFKEARATASLRHPNIVRVYDVDEAGGLPFIVSEIIDGVDLKYRIANHLANPKQAAEMCATIADAIHYAHTQHIVHRDLKPANILLDDDLVPHITDFGLAKRLDIDETQTRDGQVFGTPAYMAPEQAAGKSSQVDRRTDVYSLGVILYELTTGQVPFAGDGESLIYQRIIHETPVRPRKIRKEIPRDLETICLKAIEKKPSDRYQTAAEMGVDLQRYLQGESPLARRLGVTKRTSRRARKHPVFTSVLGGLVALSIFFVMFAISASRNERAILGIKTMNVVTLPAGAEIVFVPLSEMTGEPDPTRIIRAVGRTPLSIDLAPGDYLVVAKLDNGRFHEVYRHVPQEAKAMRGSFNHNGWILENDGRVTMPQIVIPPADIADDMVQVPGRPNFDSYLMGTAGSPAIYNISSFYIDTTEVTSKEYQRVWGERSLHDNRSTQIEPNWAKTLSYDLAVETAEVMGKRLPSAAEYEFAATAAGTRDYSWPTGTSLPAEVVEFGPVNKPTIDCFDFTSRPVYGLCSNVAEWTTTFLFSDTTDKSFASSNYRLVGGGGLELSVVYGDPSLTLEARNPRNRVAVEKNTVSRGLGFRCVRSIRPRMSAKDFGVLDSP